MHPSEAEQREFVVDVVGAVLLGLFTSMAAFAAYQASLWGGNQATAYTSAINILGEANREHLRGVQDHAFDTTLWIEQMKASEAMQRYMDAITYYLKANLVLIALLGAYALLLRRETWHAARRAWLLASASLALALPFVPMDSLSPAVIQFDLPEVTVGGAASVSAGIDRVPALILVHLAVTAALLILLFVRCIRAWRSVMDPSDADDARSFFRWIQLPREVHGPDRAALLAHERVHATHGHSFDVVLFEVSAALFWSNPIWRIARVSSGSCTSSRPMRSRVMRIRATKRCSWPRPSGCQAPPCSTRSDRQTSNTA